ncbi:MAG: glucuronate isomerase [Bacteroidota bacterium]
MSFIHDDFLLQSASAQRLYHEYAAGLPIIDYHCHIPPQPIAEDHIFENLTQIWLYGDHYKWRAMRANGVDERFCTGDASDWEKFHAWAATVPKTLNNPLYHWTHMELKHPFGITDRLLNADTAASIWKEGNEKLNTPDLSVRNIIRYFNVEVICTTDDPLDTLEYHQQIKESGFEVKVVPAFRPDKAMMVEDLVLFNSWVDRLIEITNREVSDYAGYMEAILDRHQFFHDRGCRLSDHGIEQAYADEYTTADVEAIFQKARKGEVLSVKEQHIFKSDMLIQFGRMDHEKGWVQQYHLGALRNVNSRMYRTLGPDTGFDSIGDFDLARPLGKMLDRLDTDNKLAKTILYNLNPSDNALMATMIGNFQDGSAVGKMQFGSGWWFLDQKEGIEDQLMNLSNMGLLSVFVGMLTDSRSFLSYPRHEYFRRVLCNYLGTRMDQGILPTDYDLVGGMIADISYHNAKRYFEF